MTNKVLEKLREIESLSGCRCPICHNIYRAKHKEDCPLGQAIALEQARDKTKTEQLLEKGYEHNGIGYSCPECGNSPGHGHDRNCPRFGQTQAIAEAEKVCEHEYHMDANGSYWITGCKEVRSEIEAKFCPYCGKKIKEIRLPRKDSI